MTLLNTAYINSYDQKQIHQLRLMFFVYRCIPITFRNHSYQGISVIVVLFSGLLCLLPLKANGQTLQTVKGQLLDKEIKGPVGDAVISIRQFPARSTRSDEKGFFQLTEVPLGRIDLRITKVGYLPVDLSDIQISAGKQTVLHVEMEFSFTTLKEVSIKSTRKPAKERPLNDMSQVSSRMFSVEETQRYAGSVDDPSRAIAVYPGVQVGGAGDNQIIIRGNSSRGLLWRIAGMEAYNPNHFSVEGASFGGISMITSSVLANSDFSTGAFAAEYGNALSGIFDIRLRKGNTDKREYNIQAGTLGVEAGAEGPFSATSKASYLVKYRYSSLSLAQKAGLLDFAPSYQDVIFNLQMPVKRGSFSFYGIGGDGTSNTPAERDSILWKENRYTRLNEEFNSKVGISGLTYTHNLKQGYIYSGLSYNISRVAYREDSLSSDYVLQPINEDRFLNSALRFSSFINHRIGAKHTLRIGGDVSLIRFNNLVITDNDSVPGTRKVLLDSKGNTSYIQAFGQWKFRPFGALTLVSGLHFLRYNLNGNSVIEPRFSASYPVAGNQRISAGYGLHSRLETPSTYFTQVVSPNGQSSLANKKLDLSKAHHWVLAYDWTITPLLRLKVETYYQSLFDVPVGFHEGATYSTINAAGFNYDNNQLFNQGTGKNYGAEFTLERFFNKGSYFMVTGSVFRSLYTDILNRQYATGFDRKYLVTFVGGKEWQVGRKSQNLFQLNFRLVAGGPARFTPVDLAQSKAKGYTVFDHQNPFNMKDDFYFKPDLKIAYKKNRSASNWSTGLDIVNVTGKMYLTGQRYDTVKQVVTNSYDALGIFPNVFYRWEF